MNPRIKELIDKNLDDTDKALRQSRGLTWDTRKWFIINRLLAIRALLDRLYDRQP